MTSVLILGAGKIGRMITAFLSRTQGYDVQVADADATAVEMLRQRFAVPAHTIDANNRDELRSIMTKTDIVISALSFRFNPQVAQVALETGTSYFDLTEDVETTRTVRRISESAREGQVLMPQCGLAPGFVSIVASHLTQEFDTLDTVLMRVGALPQFPSNALKYNLTWSTEGRARELNYKTIRYVGHRELMSLLVNDLRLSQRRELLKDILESAIPVTWQDVVVVFCTVSGQRNGQLTQITDARRIYHETLDGEHWSAIQITTAAAVCAVVDLFVEGKLTCRGFVKQEQVAFEDFIANRFGRYFDISGKTGLARQIS